MSVHTAKRRAMGYMRLETWMHPHTRARLGELVERFGSIESALDACVMGYPLEGLGEE